MYLFLRKAVLLSAPLAAAYSPPEPCTGWCYQDLRDPNVVVKDGTYYRFTTHHNFTIASAPSISGPWTKQGSMLQNGTMINVPSPKTNKQGEHKPKDKPPMLWAPDVYLIDDTYYLTYSVVRRGFDEIGVATSRTLKPGSWVDHGSIGLPESENHTRIDSNLFQTESGTKPILSFGSYKRGLYQVPFDQTSLKIEGKLVELAHNATNDAIEAAYVFPWKVKGKQFYYLFFSSGRCCNAPNSLPPKDEEYKTMVCRSESPTGPFADDNDRLCVESGGKMVLGSEGDVYGPGGQGVYYDEQLQFPVMYYHWMNKSTGYKVEDVYFGWNRLSFKSGWPVLMGRGDEEYNETEPKESASNPSMHLGVAELLAWMAVFAIYTAETW